MCGKIQFVLRYLNGEHLTVLWHIKLCTKLLFCFSNIFSKCLIYKQIDLHTYNILYSVYSEFNDTVIAYNALALWTEKKNHGFLDANRQKKQRKN